MEEQMIKVGDKVILLPNCYSHHQRYCGSTATVISITPTDSNPYQIQFNNIQMGLVVEKQLRRRKFTEKEIWKNRENK